MEKETYTLNVFCPNCDFRGKVIISKGTPYSEHPCPQCGIIDLDKDYTYLNEASAPLNDGYSM